MPFDAFPRRSAEFGRVQSLNARDPTDAAGWALGRDCGRHPLIFDILPYLPQLMSSDDDTTDFT